MANGDSKFGPTWKWLVGILAAALVAVAGSTYSSVTSEIRHLQQNKVDKDQYCRDVGEIKDGIRDINNWIRDNHGTK